MCSKYAVTAIAKPEIEYVVNKYKDITQAQVYIIPSQTKVLKPTNKLFPEFQEYEGFVAFTPKNIVKYAKMLTSIKYLHVVRVGNTKIPVDLRKTKDKKLPQYGIVFGIGGHPDLCLITSNKLITKYETVTKPEPVVQLTQDEKDILGAYTPDFSHPSPYMKPMSEMEAAALLPKMSADDVAWHLLNNKYAVELHDDHRFAHTHIGRREAAFLLVMNKNISKQTRDNIADWLIDKEGVSFVGGANLKDFLRIMAKKGYISKKIIDVANEEDVTDKLYYGGISDPDKLRKYSIQKYEHQLAHNEHTPADVLQKIHTKFVKDSARGGSFFKDVGWSGFNPSHSQMHGTSTTLTFSKAMEHPNYPIEEMIPIYHKYLAKYGTDVVQPMTSTLWGREDLPDEELLGIIKDVGYLLPPPAALKEKDFDSYWKKARRSSVKDSWSPYSKTVEHPNVTNAVLKDLISPDFKFKDEYDKERARTAAVNKLIKRGVLGANEIVKQVKTNLKFDGPADLLHHFGAKAWNAKGIEKLKFIPAATSEVNKIKKELQATAVHDDFTFDVLGVYNLSRDIHKDFSTTAKQLGNIQKNLYHGTSLNNAAGILASGVNVDATSRTGQMFGNGFYLATSSSKAAQYASDTFSHEGLGIIFRMDAALGKKAEWKYGRPMDDDAMYNRDHKVAKEIQKLAKKKGVFQIPVWHLDHDSVHAKKGMALQHDEYVVKNGNQIKINQVILIRKHKVD